MFVHFEEFCSPKMIQKEINVYTVYILYIQVNEKLHNTIYQFVVSVFFPVSVFSSSFLTIDPNFLGNQSSSFTLHGGNLLKSWKRNIWVFPKIGVPPFHAPK